MHKLAAYLQLTFLIVYGVAWIILVRSLKREI